MELYLKDFFTRLPRPYLQNDCKVYNSSGDELEFIDDLSKINVFVGVNNSGKSYLLRELAKTDHAPIYYSQATIDAINLAISKTRVDLQQTLNKLNDTERNEFNNNENLYITINGNDPKLEFNLEDDYIFGTLSRDVGNRFNNFDTRYNDFRSLSHGISKSIHRLKLYQGNREVYNQDKSTPPQSVTSVPEDIASEISEHLKSLCIVLSNYIFSNNEGESEQQFSKIYLYPFRTLMENLVKADSIDAKIKEYHFEDLISSNVASYVDSEGIFNFINNYKYTEHLRLITGARIPSILFNMRNSTHEELENIIEFQKFLSENFFNDQTVSLITKKHDPTKKILEPIHIKIGEAKDESIYNLGTGLQMMILLTLPLFMYERGIIYIEEPELFIHPGMQKQLMEIYANHPKAKNFQFFIATHSNHIIDSTILNDDISIYTIKKLVADKKTKFEIRNRSHGDHDALQMLGVSNSSVYLVNCTIWVEGVTDKLYIGAYIKAFLNHVKVNPSDPAFSEFKKCLHYREGTHYGFVYSGGDNIIHWDFDPNKTITELHDEPSVKYLCGEAFVVIDDDNKKNTERKEKLRSLLPKNQFKEIKPEIENLLSLEVILQAIKKYDSWKNTDIDITDKLTEFKEILTQSKLGSFIDRTLKPYVEQKKSKPKLKSFSKNPKSKNSTINDKVEFCRKAIENITYSNMTDESKELVKKILTFIIQKNQGIL